MTRTTALLASRIWWMDRKGSRAFSELEGTGHRLHPVVRIVLESGLLNAVFLFAFVMTLAFGSSSLEIMSEMVSVPIACKAQTRALQFRCTDVSKANIPSYRARRCVDLSSPSSYSVLGSSAKVVLRPPCLHSAGTSPGRTALYDLGEARALRVRRQRIRKWPHRLQIPLSGS